MSDEVAPHAGRAAEPAAEPVLPEGPVERACRVLCRVSLLALIVIVDLELVTRNVFGFSFYLSDEYGGYLLVALTFLSLPLCIAHGSFHRVTFLLDKLPDRAREGVLLGFDMLALLFSLAVLWEVSGLAANSYSLETTAPTILMTPLWIPQLVMPIGMAATSYTLARATLRRARRMLKRG